MTEFGAHAQITERGARFAWNLPPGIVYASQEYTLGQPVTDIYLPRSLAIVALDWNDSGIPCLLAIGPMGSTEDPAVKRTFVVQHFAAAVAGKVELLGVLSPPDPMSPRLWVFERFED